MHNSLCVAPISHSTLAPKSQSLLTAVPAAHIAGTTWAQHWYTPPPRSSYFDFSCSAFHTGAGAAEAIAKYFPSLAGQPEVVVCYGDVIVAKELAEFVDAPPGLAAAPARQPPQPPRVAATPPVSAAVSRSNQPVWSSDED